MDRTVNSAFDDAYAELMRLARARLSCEHAPISTGTLAHELYLKVQHRRDLRFDTRLEFLAYASRAMRSLLVDMARQRLAARRDAELVPLMLGADVIDPHGGTPEQLLALDEALNRLEQLDARLIRVVELRAVLGLEVAEIAQVLGVSEPTVKRDWHRAKAVLSTTLDVTP